MSTNTQPAEGAQGGSQQLAAQVSEPGSAATQAAPTPTPAPTPAPPQEPATPTTSSPGAAASGPSGQDLPKAEGQQAPSGLSEALDFARRAQEQAQAALEAHMAAAERMEQRAVEREQQQRQHTQAPKQEGQPVPDKPQEPKAPQVDEAAKAELEALKAQIAETQAQLKQIADSNRQRYLVGEIGVLDKYLQYAPQDADITTDEGKQKLREWAESHPELCKPKQFSRPDPHDIEQKVLKGKDGTGNRVHMLKAMREAEEHLDRSVGR